MRSLFLALVLVSIRSVASGETLTVSPDGSGDYPTIQAAINAANDGDLIALTDGVFYGDGNRDLDFMGKGLRVGSISGDAEACILDCQGSEGEPHRGFHFHSGEGPAAGVTGISIVNGFIALEPWGGALLCEGTASPVVTSCIFRGNQGGAVVCQEGTAIMLEDCEFRENAGTECGAVYGMRADVTLIECRFFQNHVDVAGGALYNYGGIVRISECVFDGNSSDYWAGAVNLMALSQANIRDSVFWGNSSESYGAVHVFLADADLDRCTFVGNTAFQQGAALGTGKSATTHLAHCTFWGNSAVLGTLSLSDGGTTMENCIVAGDTQGPSMYLEGNVDLACCDLWGNAGGDWIEEIAGQYGIEGNLSEDPQFCDPAEGDFTLNEASPCAPGHNPECGLIGAWPTGCAPTPVLQTSWGGLKALYRH